MTSNLSALTTLVVSLSAISILPVLADNITVNNSVTISESNPTQTIYHTDSFNTTLQCTVSGSPTPKTECKITSGPNYQWSPVSSPYSISPSGSVAQLGGNPQPPLGWMGPTNGVTVSVSVTWGDDKGNTYTANSQPYPVNFTTRSPQNVLNQGKAMQRVGPDQTGTYKQSYWGHLGGYVLQVMDNQYPQAGYDRGTLAESFTATQLNPKYASNLQAQGAPNASSNNQGKDTSLSNMGFITDHNDWLNASWTNPPSLDTGWTTLWFQTVQHLTVNEQSYNPTAVGSFTLYVEQGDTLRQ